MNKLLFIFLGFYIFFSFNDLKACSNPGVDLYVCDEWFVVSTPSSYGSVVLEGISLGVLFAVGADMDIKEGGYLKLIGGDFINFYVDGGATFNHRATPDALTIVLGNVEINNDGGGYLFLGKIIDEQNSNFSLYSYKALIEINMIDFSKSGSFLRIEGQNYSDSPGNYRYLFTNRAGPISIKAPYVSSISLLNYEMEIEGLFYIGYDENGKATGDGIRVIDMTGSDFLYGTKQSGSFGNVSRILLKRSSNFIDGGNSNTLLLAATNSIEIDVNDNSKFLVSSIASQNSRTRINVNGSGSEFSVAKNFYIRDHIGQSSPSSFSTTFNAYSQGVINIANLKTEITNNLVGRGSSEINLVGDSTSSFNFGKIFINEYLGDGYLFNFNDAKVNISQFEVSQSASFMKTLDFIGHGDNNIEIGSVSFTTKSNLDFKLKDINPTIGDLDLDTGESTLNVNLNSSNISLSNILCKSETNCNVTFTGNTSTINSDILEAIDSNIKIDSLDINFTEFSVKGSKLEINDNSNLVTNKVYIDNQSNLILQGGNTRSNIQKIENNGIFEMLEGSLELGSIDNEGRAIIKGKGKIDSIINYQPGNIELYSGYEVTSLNNLGELLLYDDDSTQDPTKFGTITNHNTAIFKGKGTITSLINESRGAIELYSGYDVTSLNNLGELLVYDDSTQDPTKFSIITNSGNAEFKGTGGVNNLTNESTGTISIYGGSFTRITNQDKGNLFIYGGNFTRIFNQDKGNLFVYDDPTQSTGIFSNIINSGNAVFKGNGKITNLTNTLSGTIELSSGYTVFSLDNEGNLLLSSTNNALDTKVSEFTNITNHNTAIFKGKGNIENLINESRGTIEIYSGYVVDNIDNMSGGSLFVYNDSTQGTTNFGTITNSGNAIFKGKGKITSLTNEATGMLELYSGYNIAELENKGDLWLHGGISIDTLNIIGSNSSVNFVVLHPEDIGVSVGNMVTPFSDISTVNLYLPGLAYLKPGHNNLYNIISTKQGTLALTGSIFENFFSVVPDWFVYDSYITSNNGVDATAGESISINIQRLTGYTNLVSSVPTYNEDQIILGMAGFIDDLVRQDQITISIADVINSLDLNSGCAFSEQMIYEMHQGSLVIDGSQYPCLYTLSENFNKTTPVSNETYGIYSHSNITKALDTIIANSKRNNSFEYSSGIFAWTQSDFSLISLEDSDSSIDRGFTGNSTNLYMGISSLVSESFVLSAMGSVGVGEISSNIDLYNSKAFSVNGGLSMGYISRDDYSLGYYIIGAGVFGITDFTTNRNIDFLNNEFATNKSTVSTADLAVNELSFKLESGVDVVQFITSKVFISYSLLNNSGYEETGSSASLIVDKSNMSILDAGAGIEFFYTGELLSPKLGINVVERMYDDPLTSVRFLGLADSYINNITSKNNSGTLLQADISLMMQKEMYAIEFGYLGEASATGYQNHKISGFLKYDF